ncbi:MAG: glycosyl hydrolase family 18 protein, partial [Clostridia bacterium]|nr:glycosyl hydrolase family 18 protein [Clostridia bacterium]
ASDVYKRQTQYSAGISCDAAVKNHIKAGVPASKICLGFPFYGRNGSEWPTYKTLVANFINKNGWTRKWDDAAKACYLTNTSGGFITYDDVESFGYKTAYIKANKLGGAMFWEYSQDNIGTLLNKIYEDLK